MQTNCWLRKYGHRRHPQRVLAYHAIVVKWPDIGATEARSAKKNAKTLSYDKPSVAARLLK